MAGALRRNIARSSALTLYASILFVVLTLLAMWFYPGGTAFDPDAERYRFFGNFFSDLGATRSHSGRANTVSMVLFVVATVAIGLAMIQFSGAWRAIHARRRRARLSGVFSQLFLVLAGLSFIGIAATPWDHLLAVHDVFVRWAFVLLLGYLVALLHLQAKNHWPRRYMAFNVLYLVALALYVGLLFAGPTLATPAGAAIQVAAQKIIVYASMLNLGLQALGVRGHLSAL